MTVPSVCVTAVAHYLSKGIGENVAAGMVGVFNYESGVNPTAVNNSGTDAGGVLNRKGAYGIAQWNGPRQGNGKTGLADFAKDKGLDPAALTTQLDFVLTECANEFASVWAAIQSNMAVADFIPLFVRTYENPANPAPEIASALATAQNLLKLSAPISSPAPAPVPVAATPAPTIATTPTPTPSPLGVTLMDPALIEALAPFIESLAAGILRAVLAQISPTTTGTPPAVPVAPAIDLGALVTSLVPLLTAQLGTSLPALIAAEVAKLIPPLPVAKS